VHILLLLALKKLQSEKILSRYNEFDNEPLAYFDAISEAFKLD